MKVTLKKSELKESIKNALLRALSETELFERFYDDDDEDDAVSRFLKNPKNQLPKRLKGAGAAKKAALADIKKEVDSDEKDDNIADKDEKEEMSKES